ncbi:MAG: tRNA (adenosine(37)-N6)-dimethylallyltransferase MiaA [Deltaproteobacteria bacterium]|nr:MAG: tRNA (adenosine(37)-N6)-dimethylallyltransferase MiaA [Deltaproteobacteria bacterium]
MKNIPLIVLVGPTATGKSKMAIYLAKQIGGEIVSADSMLVYKGMDIGTAKPTQIERDGIKHHLIDLVNPDETFNVARFRALASKVIKEIYLNNKRIIVVGGTGLYIKALLYGLFSHPPIPNEISEKIKKIEREKGQEGLFSWLSDIDPESAKNIHPNDRIRTIRALEIFLMTGRSIKEFHKEHAFKENYYDPLLIGLWMDKKLLYKRIEERTDEMIEKGFVDEVKYLLAKGYNPELPSMKALGYRQIIKYLQKEISLDKAIHLIKRDTKRYAKRQFTWFKKVSGINWFYYPYNKGNILKMVKEFINQKREGRQDERSD